MFKIGGERSWRQASIDNFQGAAEQWGISWSLEREVKVICSSLLGEITAKFVQFGKNPLKKGK